MKHLQITRNWEQVEIIKPVTPNLNSSVIMTSGVETVIFHL